MRYVDSRDNLQFEKVPNVNIKTLIIKAVALVGVFTRSAVNNDALRAIQKDTSNKGKEELEYLQHEADDIQFPDRKMDSDGDESDKETQDPNSIDEVPESSEGLSGSFEEVSPRSRRNSLEVLKLASRNDTRRIRFYR